MPEHKFGFAVDAVEELALRWDEYAAFVSAAAPPPKPSASADEYTKEQSTNFQRLRQQLADPYARSLVLMSHALVSPAVPLLGTAKKNLRLVPMDFWTQFKAWTDSTGTGLLCCADDAQQPWRRGRRAAC